MDTRRDLKDAIVNIRQVANMEERAFKLFNGADLKEIAAKLIVDAGAKMKGKTAFKYKMTDNKIDKMLGLGRSYWTELMLNPTTFFEGLGESWENLSRAIHEQTNEESERMIADKESMKKLWEIYSKKEKKLLKKDIFIIEWNTSVPKLKLLEMASHLGTEGNRQRLFSTPPIGLENAQNWNEQTVLSVLQRALSEKDWKFVQGKFETINSHWGDVVSLSKEMTGFSPSKVEAMPFVVNTSDGKTINMKGGYYPLNMDARGSLRAEALTNDNPLYKEKNPAYKAATKKKHTKTRSQAANYAVNLDSETMYSHLRDVNHDLAFRSLVSDLNRLMANTEIQRVVVNRYGPEGLKSLNEYIKSVASADSEHRVSGIMEKTSRFMRKHTVVAALLFRLGVSTQNIANVILYGGAVKNFSHADTIKSLISYGLFNYIPKSLANWQAAAKIRESIYEKSSFMRDKKSSVDYTLNELHDENLGQDSKIQKFGGYMMAFTDELTSIPVWMGAYEKMMKETNGNEKESIYYADMLIKKSIGSSRKTDQAAYARGSEQQKLLTMFYGFMNTWANRWIKESRLVTDNGLAGSPRFLGFIGSHFFAFTILSAMMSGKGPDDDEDWFAWWSKEILKAPFGFFPIARELTQVAFDEAFGGRSFSYRPSPTVSMVEAGINLGKTGWNLAVKDGDSRKFAEALTKAAAYALPYPEQFNVWAWNAYDMFNNNMEPEFKDLYKRRPANKRRD